MGGERGFGGWRSGSGAGGVGNPRLRYSAFFIFLRLTVFTAYM